MMRWMPSWRRYYKYVQYIYTYISVSYLYDSTDKGDGRGECVEHMRM